MGELDSGTNIVTQYLCQVLHPVSVSFTLSYLKSV